MNHLETQKNIKRNFANVEQAFPVDKWVVDDIHVWPYIRIKLYYAMLASGNTSKHTRKESSKSKNSSPLTKKLKIALNVVRAFFSLKFFFFNLKRKKILFFGAHFHRVLQDGKYFNRFYDSMVEHHNLHNDVYMVEFQKVYNNTYNQTAVIPLEKHLNDYKLLHKLKSTIVINKHKISLGGYDKFCEVLSKLNISSDNLNISEPDLLKWVIKIKSIEPFYQKLYKKTNPLKIIFLSYYGYDDLYAAVKVANSMSLKTVDFQHGPQTNVHMAYSNWLKVPKRGFNIMPREFWVWDQNSKINIEKWNKKVDLSQAKIFGQPYIAYWNNRQTKSEKANKKEIILYTMQTSPLELFSPKLINLIKMSDSKWVLRLHPRNNVSIDEIEDFLSKNEINNNTIIQDAIDEPLPEVLNRTVLHVTNYSGCTIEAKMMNVPTILIHNLGYEMFKMYLDDKSVHYIDQNEDYFESDFNKIEKNIKVASKIKILNIPNPINFSY